MVKARVIQVIETYLEQRGKGTPEDPTRRIMQYWTLDGELLAEVDHYKERQSDFSTPFGGQSNET